MVTKVLCTDCCEVVSRELAIFQRDNGRPPRCGWNMADFYRRK